MESDREALIELAKTIEKWRRTEKWPAERRFIVHGPNELRQNDMTQVAGTEMWIQSKQWLTIVGGSLPCIVQLLIEFDGKTSRCLEVRCSTRRSEDRVTATVFRQIPVDDLQRAATQEITRFYRQDSEGRFFSTPFTHGTDAETRQHAHARRRRISVDDLEAAAAVYLRAIASGQHPTAAVERELGLANRNTAKKRVQQARTAGLLGPSIGERQAGASLETRPTGQRRKTSGRKDGQ